MKNNEFTLKQMFSIVDGRLSTGMDDVYAILDIAAGRDLTTIALPFAMDNILEVKPKWYMDALIDLNEVKKIVGNDFETLMNYLDSDTRTYKVELLNK